MRKARFPIKILLLLLIPLGLLLVRYSSMNPALVEKFYSEGLYPPLGGFVSTVTGILPFSLAELIVAVIPLIFLWKLVRLIVRAFEKKNDFLAVLSRSVINLLVFLSIAYFSFLVIWGFNYYRLPFSSIAGLDVQPASVEELEKVCRSLIVQANSLRRKVDEGPDGVMGLSGSKNDMLKRAGLGYRSAALFYPQLGGHYGQAKKVMLSRAMSYTGISGIYFPFTAEANLNILMPDSMLPNTVCHEMAHQRGFAREDEANYISYLTCRLNPGVDFQYSGTLLALIYSMNALHSHDAERYEDLVKSYDPGIVRDLKAVDEFWDQYEGFIEETTDRINNAYLKANNQKDGVFSYGRMVDLLIAEYRKTHE